MVYVIDFGSQYSHLIGRRVRALGVEATLLPFTAPLSQLKNAKAIILSGGPSSAYAVGAPSYSKQIFTLGIPVLGVCYGMQLMAQQLGGKVERGKKGEYGPAILKTVRSSRLFVKVPKQSHVWMSHGDIVTKLSAGFSLIAKTNNSPDAAMANEKKKLYGIQFHPEVEHTDYGTMILKNFLFTIAKCEKDWNISGKAEEKVAQIKKTVGDAQVVAAVSGGVDSTVTAALISRAIGSQLTAIFVNHGLARKNEPTEVRAILSQLGCRVRYVNAKKQFLSKLRGVTFGEQKRKIIGGEFIKTFDRAVKQMKSRPTFLAQGTIYSDVIESAAASSGKTARVIKSHHNVGGLPKHLKWKLIEPLRDLYKDEVRELGEALGLPRALVWRQPFPGPGLAIRVAGEVTPEKLRIVRDADQIVRDEIQRIKKEDEFYHYFAQVLSQKTVGLTGDERAYAYPVVVRIITSSDIMTAEWARLPHEFLARLSWRITNEVKGVTRVLYDITSKPPATTEWE
ncbi:glutamine-hydrolyzing GMP synthase [Candidatus Uhrbacteria bacterium CG10_big_fil_rev_8_21_14_0_10_48_11]|uniref:GMP synthase [glutamine-hydrolyzing] n=1 Tax=Candidatus Uhrbacteria bacterium CG10_big_fil_rev_8_21_14_0_10_48_11 TaxID=1975037 RepID=A0A2M8LDT9_9BACT|nr:MAG: glutamine-hydrolyzing GMP synthase [Candidatus Uhrbacteria bacterium CG10_big_fil_rev_8_21_14_0_10_48_11]